MLVEAGSFSSKGTLTSFSQTGHLKIDSVDFRLHNCSKHSAQKVCKHADNLGSLRTSEHLGHLTESSSVLSMFSTAPLCKGPFVAVILAKSAGENARLETRLSARGVRRWVWPLCGEVQYIRRITSTRAMQGATSWCHWIIMYKPIWYMFRFEKPLANRRSRLLWRFFARAAEKGNRIHSKLRCTNLTRNFSPNLFGLEFQKLS